MTLHDHQVLNVNNHKNYTFAKLSLKSISISFSIQIEAELVLFWFNPTDLRMQIMDKYSSLDFSAKGWSGDGIKPDNENFRKKVDASTFYCQAQPQLNLNFNFI